MPVLFDSLVALMLTLLLVTAPGAVAFGEEAPEAQPTLVRHPVGRNDADQRYDYMVKLLRLILDRTQDSHGPYRLIPATPMSQERIVRELERGRIEVAQLPISDRLNQKLLAIQIPIRKGMLGWRLLLIRKEDQAKFAEVRSIEDLKQLRAGFGSQWGDLGIFEANVGRVTTHNDYDQLFTMLIGGRFDYLNRGLHEPWDEVRIREKSHPNLHIERTLCLHYPIANYLYVGKENTALADRLEQGFGLMMADGSFDRFFTKEYGEIIERANIKNRRLIEFQNPFLPPGTPLEEQRYWLEVESLISP